MKDKTTPVYVRLGDSLIKEIEKLSNFEKIDKNDWIRRAIISEIDKMDEEADNIMIEEYLALRINEKELLEHFGWKEIPADLKKTRGEYLNKIKGKISKK